MTFSITKNQAAKRIIDEMRLHAAMGLDSKSDDNKPAAPGASIQPRNAVFLSMGARDRALRCLGPIVAAKDLNELGKGLQLLQSTVLLEKIPVPDKNGLINDWTFEQVFYFQHFTAIQVVMANYKVENYGLPSLGINNGR